MKDSRNIKIAKKKCGSPECQRFQEVMVRLTLLTPNGIACCKGSGRKEARHCEFKKTRSTEGRIRHSFASFKSESGVLAHGRRPFREFFGALTGLFRGPFRDLVLCPFGTWLGCFQKHTGEKEKQQAENAKQALRALSFCLVGFAHTRRMHAVQK